MGGVINETETDELEFFSRINLIDPINIKKKTIIYLLKE